jgi:hypothetical protein
VWFLVPSALIGGEALFDGVSIADRLVVVMVAYLREAGASGVRDGGRNIYASNEVVVGGVIWKAYRARGSRDCEGY